MNHQTIIVLDFGGQYNQLIARRVRECGVYCEVKPYTTPLADLLAMKPIGFIFTGGPNSVYLEDAPHVDPALFDAGVPVLGICYGCQLIAHHLGGKVVAANDATAREYGKTETFFDTNCKLFKGLPEKSVTWMSHGDYMEKVPEGFSLVAHSDACPNVAICDETRGFYGVQYHPEVNHTEFGTAMIRNFLYEVCGATGDWTMGDYKNTAIAAVREKVGSGRVLLALSGGVDSSTAAALLREQGYICGGAMLRLCREPEVAHLAAQSAEDARRTAERLGMDFYLFDETERFSRCVMEKFVAEYCAGRTPNPCIDCNRELKFGALLDRALEMGYDYLATGHYARIDYDQAAGRWRLLRGRDRKKDQSYVLYQLTQFQLSHLLLPVGDFDKDAIRQEARQAGLDVADKSDSQDICFIPDGDYVQFLRQHGAELTPGDFVDKDGRVLGRHKGLPCYTSGQRKGLGVAAGKHVYVVRKNGADNTILLGDDADLFSAALTASRVNWIAGEAPAAPVRCTAKTRYSQHIDAPCTAYPLAGEGVRVVFDAPQRAITAGQSVVLYDGDEVLGGGVIDGAE